MPDLEALILRMLSEREGSLCPSEVARAAADDWRPLMPAIREAAARLAKADKVLVTQKGHGVDALTARGPIRIRKNSVR